MDEDAYQYNEEYSSHLFTISYAGRELSCLVDRKGNDLDVLIDNDMQAKLKLNADGTLQQVSGNELPASTIDFIKKQVIEHGTENS